MCASSVHNIELICLILNHLESVGWRGPCGARLGSEWGPRGVLAGPPPGPCGVRAGSVAGMPLPFSESSRACLVCLEALSVTCMFAYLA